MAEARVVLTLARFTTESEPISQCFCEEGSTEETWKVEMVPYKRWDSKKRWFILSASPDADLQGVKVRVYDDDYDQLVIDARIGKVTARPFGWRPVYNRIIHERDFERRQRAVNFRSNLRLQVIVSYNKKPSADDERHPFAQRSSTSLSHDLDQLLQSGGSADFTFEVEGEEIPAHKIILSSRSSYFRALFNSGMSEATTNRLVVDDIDATTFKAVLKFLYCGRLPEDLRTSAMKYIPVAEKYDIEILRGASENALSQSLTLDNGVDALVLAELYNCPYLKMKAIYWFFKFKTSLSEEKLKPLEAHPKLLLRIFSFFPCVCQRPDVDSSDSE